MSSEKTCPSANGTELHHQDPSTGARYAFITLCGINVHMPGDVSAAATTELTCVAACINANKDLPTMVCQGVTFSETDGCILHSSNEYVPKAEGGFDSFWLHNRAYEVQSAGSIEWSDTPPETALASAAAIASPHITQAPSLNHAARIAANDLVTSYSTYYSSGPDGYSCSTQWARTVIITTHQTTTIIIISDSTTTYIESGSGGGGSIWSQSTSSTSDLSNLTSSSSSSSSIPSISATTTSSIYSNSSTLSTTSLPTSTGSRTGFPFNSTTSTSSSITSSTRARSGTYSTTSTSMSFSNSSSGTTGTPSSDTTCSSE